MLVLSHPVVQALARLCLASPFLAAGIYKLVDWQAGEVEMAHSGLAPAWLFNALVLVTELVGAALVITGRRIWLGAGALGIFTVLTTFIAHRFWLFDGSEAVSEFNAFLEHAAIAAAFVLVTTAARSKVS
ncbi:DoxX family protein [Lichenihabitans sp. Uapishka_5]|uniref:DoxX family protein n=1 Tax=Lichenihabitans sp. Uapishka_5 TaxID=3037302 RepID=UPI0029E8261B|nr:DoxX family protein [Lichenihabitans sp. Uapishka_5]MDX7951840.1 DoxX family protein [Lichenihabitans sp. Uapishka_5]